MQIYILYFEGFAFHEVHFHISEIFGCLDIITDIIIKRALVEY